MLRQKLEYFGDADNRPTEEVAFYCNKIAFGDDDAGRITSMSWDQERNRYWPDGLNRLFDFTLDPR